MTPSFNGLCHGLCSEGLAVVIFLGDHGAGLHRRFQQEFQMIPLSIQHLARLQGLVWPLLGSCLVTTGVHASSCITAGRMDAGTWAPQFPTVRLLDAEGRLLPVKNKSELTRVRGVELTDHALLSACEGAKPLTRGSDTVATKSPVPAARPGRLGVVGVGFPKLQTGGELVELEVVVAADQIVMLTR